MLELWTGSQYQQLVKFTVNDMNYRFVILACLIMAINAIKVRQFPPTEFDDYIRTIRNSLNRPVPNNHIISEQKECHRREYKVPIGDIFPFVIRPHELDIGLCEGTCTIHGINLPTMYHNLLRLAHPNLRESTKCVPTRFRGFNMTFFDNHSYSLKTAVVFNSVVDECSCL